MKRNFTFPDFAINLVNSIYERLFHEKISNVIRNFLKNISYVALGTFVATFLSTAYNILSGRILGPVEYGKFTMVQSVAMFLYIPMSLGFNTAMVKYNSEKEDFDRQSKIISTVYILVFLFTIASSVVYFIFSSGFSDIFSVSHEGFYLSLIFAVFFVFYTITTSTLKGLFKMKILAIFQPVYSVILLFAFLFFVLSNYLSFKSIVYSMFLAYGAIGVILFTFFLRRYFRFKFDRAWANTLIKYSMFGVIGGLSYVFYTNTDRILINKYMTVADVGIYKVYYMSSINTSGLIFGVFNTVFFPTVSKYGNKKYIFKKINKVIPLLISIGLPSIFLCELVVLKLYGSQYPFIFLWMILFAIASICVVVDGIYGWLLSSVGRQGVKLTSIAAITMALVNIGLNIILVPLIGITGAIISTIVSFVTSIVIMLYFGRKYLVKQNDEELC
jgi:O-antigen/teichoic acid export membrane protein